MKQTRVFLSCAAALFLGTGCTAIPDAGPTQIESTPVSLDTGSCYIAGEKFVSDSTITLNCSGEASARIVFEDGEAISTSGQLYGWTPIRAGRGTSDDPNFVRVQIQKGDRVCAFGRKLDEAPDKTWKSCTTKDKPGGGKVTRPDKSYES